MKSSARAPRKRAALIAGTVLGASVVADPPAQAHHSFAMFNADQTVTLTGTVKSYAFRMPHVWFFIVTAAPGGAQEEWGCEMSSPNLAVRKGWNIDSLKAGDKVTVAMHPMRDGAKAGSVVSVVMPDGGVMMN